MIAAIYGHSNTNSGFVQSPSRSNQEIASCSASWRYRPEMIFASKLYAGSARGKVKVFLTRCFWEGFGPQQRWRRVDRVRCASRSLALWSEVGPSGSRRSERL